MTIDRFDAAVIERHFRAGPIAAPPAVALAVKRSTEDGPAAGDADHHPEGGADPIPRRPGSAPCRVAATPSRVRGARAGRPAANASLRSGVVRRLLDAVPEEWARAATAILEQRANPLTAALPAGFRVAFVGVDRAAGCSTVVDGIAATLASRGIGVVVKTLDRSAAAMDDSGSADGADDPEQPAAPDRIAIIDASGWFGPGPIRRALAGRLQRVCDAAILVRRASAEPPIAHARALESAGVRVLGEVLAFVPSGAGDAVGDENVPERVRLARSGGNP